MDPIFPSTQSSSFPVHRNDPHVADTDIKPGVGGFSFSFSAGPFDQSTASLPSNIDDAFSSDDESDRRSRASKRKEKKEVRLQGDKKRKRSPPSAPRIFEKKERHGETSKKDNPDAKSYLSNNPKHVFMKDAGVTPQHAFCISTKPDSHNFAFDETYWKSVPKFRRPPRWVMGESGRRRWKKKADPRYFQFAKELSFMRSNAGTHVMASDDVVPFGRNYLPMTEQVQVIDLEDEIKETEESELTRARTKFYNSKLTKHPTNISLWMEFIHFQDEAAKMNFGTSALKNSSGVLQRKIAILERAMEQNPGNLELRLKRLAMCEHLWEKDQLVEEWRKLAFDRPNNPYVWTSYLSFLKSYFPAFSVARVGKAFQKYVSVSLSIDSGQLLSHPARPFHMEHVILQASLITQFWIESGYQEKGLAFQQALLELNLNLPDSLSSDIPLKEALIFLEQFWDTGLARVGEKDAVGWHQMKKVADPSVSCDSMGDMDILENTIIQESTSSTALWQKLESLRTRQYLLPCHGSDDPSDPERVILFDDISPYLFRFNLDIHLQFLVVTSLLRSLHCRMPRLWSTKSYVGKIWSQPILTKPLGGLFHNWTESHCCLGTSDNCGRMVFGSFGQEWSDVDTVIDHIFEQSIGRFSDVYQTYLCVTWLQHKLVKFAEDGMTKCAAKNCRNLAKTLLKKLENRSNLIIWEWYAFCECTLETKESAAIDVLEKVLSSTKSASNNPEQLASVARSVRFYVELSLGILSGNRIPDTFANRSRCLRLLVQFAEETEMNLADHADIPPSRILKCRKCFEHLLEIQPDFSSRIFAFGSAVSSVAICYALFEYLTTGFDGAVEIVQTRIDMCRKELSSMANVDFAPKVEMLSMDCEILTEALVRLAYYHQRNSRLSSSDFRLILLSALKDFPTNEILLGQFIRSEMAVFVSGRLREYFDAALKEADSAVPWLFAIFAEYERKYRLVKNWAAAKSYELIQEISLTTFKDTGITYKLRSLFERAVESDSAKHCALIWQLYLKFEMDNEELAKAEAIYYRAIQNCPWSKDVYMAAAKYFPHRTQEIVDVMTEKELRVYTPFEESDLLMSTKKNVE